MRKARKNYFIYLMMLLIFGGLIYTAIAGGERFLHLSSIKPATAGDDAFTMFKTILLDNLEHPFSILLIQIIVVLIAVRIFASAFRYIGQPGVIGEIVAGIVLGKELEHSPQISHPISSSFFRMMERSFSNSVSDREP